MRKRCITCGDAENSYQSHMTQVESNEFAFKNKKNNFPFLTWRHEMCIKLTCKLYSFAGKCIWRRAMQLIFFCSVCFFIVSWTFSFMLFLQLLFVYFLIINNEIIFDKIWFFIMYIDSLKTICLLLRCSQSEMLISHVSSPQNIRTCNVKQRIVINRGASYKREVSFRYAHKRHNIKP